MYILYFWWINIICFCKWGEKDACDVYRHRRIPEGYTQTVNKSYLKARVSKILLYKPDIFETKKALVIILTTAYVNQRDKESRAGKLPKPHIYFYDFIETITNHYSPPI